MTLKSLSTQFNEIVFLQHIQTIKIEDADTYFKSVGYPDNYGSSYEAVLTATLDNGDVVELAEYEDYNTCEDIFQSIAVWASLKDDTSVFILWHEDLADEIKKQKDKYGRNYFI